MHPKRHFFFQFVGDGGEGGREGGGGGKGKICISSPLPAFALL